MNKPKKTIFTLNVDNYAPEITAITYPLIERYAEKIGADFHIISERKNPDKAPVYEKLQIYDLAREMKNDWNIFLDSDALVHPDTIDFTDMIGKDTVMHNGCDVANVRWRYDEYFRRDGRNIGSCNWCAIASDWCVDLWHPLDIPYEEALNNIKPIPNELNTLITREHLIDDYTLSRNIAKYGLKFKTVLDLLPEKRLGGSSFFWHEYTIPVYEKVRRMKQIVRDWGVYGAKKIYYKPSPEIQGWMTDNELQWLYENALEMDTIAEIGSWKGRSTHALASGCDGNLLAVDTFKGSPDELETTHKEALETSILEQFRYNMRNFTNMDILVEDSVTAALTCQPKSVDMVFIDGGHSDEQFEKDLKAWMPIAKKLLCGHDYPQVARVLNKLNLHPVIECDSIWSVEIK